MKTNNHPAHGPVSLERLHQIREILSKAAAQSDGGNLGYAMADAVKVIDRVIAAFGAEPVAWTEKCEITNMQATGLYLRGFPDNSQGRDIALYTAPPAPVMPDFYAWFDSPDRGLSLVNSDTQRKLQLQAWNAWYAAMLQAGNSPVTPDGYVLVPIKPTENMIINGFESEPDEFFSKSEEWDAYQEMSGCEQAAHRAKLCWAAMIKAAPQQEVKNG
ncbi:hypothetical protein ACQYAW_001349 [Citrobacter freundii]|nr:hypothetical protein [Citrobacter freundii]